jgi:K+:H+ antiporter
VPRTVRRARRVEHLAPALALSCRSAPLDGPLARYAAQTVDHSAPAIFDIGLVLLLAAAAGWLARRVGLPAVVGYMAVGLAISPFTPGYVADREQIQLLADVGVVLLLFEVGIELDVVRLGREQRSLAWASPVQTALTTAVGAAALYLAGLPPLAAAILGLGVALSSGVVVVNITRSRRRTTDHPTEEALLGWSVLQDVTGVAIGAVLVGLLGAAGRPIWQVLVLLAAFGAMAAGWAFALPRVLRAIRDDHDLFLIVSVASGLVIAGLGSLVFGVPLALASFVAGLAISEGPDTGEARRRLRPFRDVFAVLFFVAVGSLIDPAVLPAGLPWLGLFLVLLVVSKSLLTYVLARIARLPVRPLQLAIGLSQVGEFSYVLAAAALAAGVIAAEVFAGMLAAIVVSIAVSTLLVRVVGDRAERPAVGEGSAIM